MRQASHGKLRLSERAHILGESVCWGVAWDGGGRAFLMYWDRYAPGRAPCDWDQPVDANRDPALRGAPTLGPAMTPLVIHQEADAMLIDDAVAEQPSPFRNLAHCRRHLQVARAAFDRHVSGVLDTTHGLPFGPGSNDELGPALFFGLGG